MIWASPGLVEKRKGFAKMSHNTNDIHQLLRVVFDDEKIVSFCFDYFPSVYKQFSSGDSRIKKFQLLINYCETGDNFEELLSQIKQFHPRQYSEFIIEEDQKAEIERPSLPGKTYHRLIGRQDQLDQVMSALHESERKPMIAIIGLGGIGKTALAREIAELCSKENLFDYVVWTSAKTEHFTGQRIVQQEEITLKEFDSLLNEIGRQCNRMDIAMMPTDQKKASIANLLAASRVLLVLDNWETVPNREELIREIFDLLGQSRLLITSRFQIQHERAFTLKLSGFPKDESANFLREEGRERNIAELAKAEISILREIHVATGGVPLAMKLVVGQMVSQPMKAVLNTLKQASAKGQDEEFYRFIYWHSWNLLEHNSRITLVDLSVFPPNTGGQVEDVEKISDLEPNAFWAAMHQLVMMSLVDKIGTLGKERFALHTLTHNFILSDITEEWSD